MRIGILTATFLPKIGGAEICIDQLARCYVGAGHEVVVLTQDHPDAAATDEQLGYRVARYATPWSQAGYYRGVKRRLSRLHDEKAFDVLNPHMAYPAGYVGAWFRSRYNVPVIVTTHGGAIFNRSRFRRRRRIWQRIVRSLNAVDGVVSLSSYSDRVLSEFVEAERIVRIGNGVDCKLYSRVIEVPERLAELCASPYILGLGRLIRGKGFDIALDALAQARGGTGDAKLVFAGDGRDRNRLEELTRKYDLEDRVVFLGTVTGADKVALLQNCLFTVLPSTIEDNMPLVVLESMACGKPVLASDIGGIGDLVRPGETGWLSKAGDSRELTERMVGAMNGDVLVRVAERCRQTARENDWSVVAQRYVQLFEDKVRQTRLGG